MALVKNLAYIRDLSGIRNIKAWSTSMPYCQTTWFSPTKSYSQDSIVKRESNFFEKKKQKKIPRSQPVLKNFFIDVVEKDMFEYPEVLPKAQYEEMMSVIEPTKQFMRNEVNSTQIDQDGEIPDSVTKGITGFGLFAAQVPEEYSGLNFNLTSTLMVREALSGNASISSRVAMQHDLVIKMLMLYGSDEQKDSYLTKLANGSLIGTLCIGDEHEGVSFGDNMTTASLGSEGDMYYITGKKMLVQNPDANLILVAALTSHRDIESNVNAAFSLFIIDRENGGVKVESIKPAVGSTASPLATICFDTVLVPLDRMLGKRGHATTMLEVVSQEARLATGSVCAGILKDLIKMYSDNVLERKEFGNDMEDYGSVKSKLATMSTDLYAIESMTYYTAGLIDTFESVDASLESAACKIFSSERTLGHLVDCAQLLGNDAQLDNGTLIRSIRDRLSACYHEGRNDLLKSQLGYRGLHYAGRTHHVHVRQTRNPLVYPNEGFKRVWEMMKVSNLSRKRKHNIYRYLHPALTQASDIFEFHLMDFALLIKTQLEHDGAEIVAPNNQQRVLVIADIAATLYAFMTTLSRASRSYCLGHPHSDHEMLLVGMFARKYGDELELKMQSVKRQDQFYDAYLVKEVSDEIFNNKGYHASHPVFRHMF